MESAQKAGACARIDAGSKNPKNASVFQDFEIVRHLFLSGRTVGRDRVFMSLQLPEDLVELTASWNAPDEFGGAFELLVSIKSRSSSGKGNAPFEKINLNDTLQKKLRIGVLWHHRKAKSPGHLNRPCLAIQNMRNFQLPSESLPPCDEAS